MRSSSVSSPFKNTQALNGLMHETTHEADGSAADQQQEDEDVERGHTLAASLGQVWMKAPRPPRK